MGAVRYNYRCTHNNAGVAKWYTQLTQNQPVETPWGFESPRRHHIGASLASLAPIFFFKKSECAHAAASPFPIEPAALGCDSVGRVQAGMRLYF